MRLRIGIFLAIAFHVSGAWAAPIHDISKTGDVGALTALLDAGADVNESNGIATPLFYAIKNGHFDAAKLLVDRGADVNLAAKWGPPLMAGAELGQFEFVKLLLDAGADATVEFKQQTALHIASGKGCLDCVEALVENGADVNSLNYLHQPPVHLALASGHRAVGDYLFAHGYRKPTPPPIAALLASADPLKGEALFKKDCADCHFVEAGKENFLGPNLWNVVGQAKGSAEGFKYSAAMREKGGDWSFEELNVFLSAPFRTMPGTDMVFVGLPDDADRADLIAFLRTRGDNPDPLPR